MKLSSFDFELPKTLIANHPSKERTGSRLLVLDGATGSVSDQTFKSLIEELKPEDLLVFNNTRVIPARIFAKKSSGGKLEVLVERIVDDYTVLAHVRSSKSPKPGALILFPDDQNVQAEMVERKGSLFVLKFNQPILNTLEKIGHMPLPPYIDRSDEEEDRERYQTVYSAIPGAVAAPTAGLHFDDEFLDRLREKGIDTTFVTLHVGAGTFQPVKVDNVLEHEMHSEWLEVSQDVVEKIKQTKARGGRVIAVGTTSVRSLESAARNGQIEAMSGDTDIFIYPGYRFNVVDAMVTNFHLPESTLLMLISAFGGYQYVMAAYQHAIKNKYRFFSYGDAMFITRNDHANAEEVNDAR